MQRYANDNANIVIYCYINIYVINNNNSIINFLFV